MNRNEFSANKKDATKTLAHALGILKAVKYRELYDITFTDDTRVLIRVWDVSTSTIGCDFLAGMGDYGWILNEAEIHTIKSLTHVSITDLPLYINWSVKTDEFMELIKKGI